MRPHSRSPRLWVAAAAAFAALLWAAAQGIPPPPAALAGLLPGGALMTVESSDFASLLSAWMHSPEQRAWLGSAAYSAFANSRLFSRLADAQTGFARAAQTSPDTAFLEGVAGRETIFAWYNIGNLECLYITHLSHEQATGLTLLGQRASFARRESAGTPFYVRSASATESAAPEGGTSPAAAEITNQPRTVAFALHGDWLLLATREDLMANALQLMSARATGGAGNSEADAPWFAAATAAAPAQHGDLHMVLNLQELTRTPQFRSYWTQRNVTETRRFRAAVVDLYRERGRFREERLLLPMDTSSLPEEANLGELEALVPEGVGIARAVARPGTDAALAALDEKLLHPVRNTPEEAVAAAPPPSAEVSPAGSASDLDQRIDTPAPPADDPLRASDALGRALDDAGLESMLTLSRSDGGTPDDPSVRLHAAIVLRARTPWNAGALGDALRATLSPELTLGALGLAWKGVPAPAGTLVALTGPRPLSLFTDGSLAVLSDDPGLLGEILTGRARPATSERALLAATLHPGRERSDFRRLTTQLAGIGPATDGSGPTGAVQLFRDVLPSLADTFSALSAERMVERREGTLIHQTVLYEWGASRQQPPPPSPAR